VRTLISLSLGLVLYTSVGFAQATVCSPAAEPAAPAGGLLAPAPGLDNTLVDPASASSGLAGSSPDLSATAVLARLRQAECEQTPQVSAEGYQKRTEFDNAPYRYNMQSGGTNSAQFAAWMASRGIRIVPARVDDAAGADAALAEAASGTTGTTGAAEVAEVASGVSNAAEVAPVVAQ
jgi:hypothetical protein